MNQTLASYIIDVEDPQASGAEHFQLLLNRDALAAAENELTDAERDLLHQADGRLLEQASAFQAALSRFLVLAEVRRERVVPPAHWWWYLDVLSEAPLRPAASSASAA